MRHFKSWQFAGLVMVTLLATQSVRAQLTDDQARDAIERGVRFLRERQNGNGSWREMMPMAPGGITALCTLAMLNAGEPVESESVQKALGYLRSLDKPDSVYVTSLQTMVLCAAEPQKDKAMIVRNVQWLENVQLKEGPRAGCWSYGQGRGGGDNSNAQFALLALHEAERAGVPVKAETWELALKYWLKAQRDDGSWGYTESDPSTASMTCAGIASVIICSGRVNQGDAQVVAGRVQCCGEQADNDAVERGLKWLGSRFSVAYNPSTLSQRSSYLFYYLYGLERVGRMSGRRFIGGHDWFREGAEMFVSRRDAITGSWRGAGHAETEPLIATPLALLFLGKGRRPVVMSKLRHGEGNDWDLHRSGVQNLTARVEQRWRRDLSWQTIDVQNATVEDLLESPVLFLSGRQALSLTAEQEENLRKYVSHGGFLFAEACCGGTEFDRSMRELLKRLFPDSQLRLLPADHPIWYAEQKVDPNFMKPLYGIDACCRTSVVYCPQDLSCYWELSPGSRDSGYPDPIKKEIEASLRIGANVLTYATNRELKNKLDRTTLLARDPREDGLERGTLYIAKLMHGGGSDDAPNALPNLLQFLRAQTQMRVFVDNRQISATNESIFEYPLIYMHGRRAFRFTPAERQALATYLERGGIIFGDSICASPQFTDSFRQEIEAIMPGQTLGRIPPDHSIFTRAYRGFDLPRVTVRDPQARRGDDPLRANLMQVSPLLEGLVVDDRVSVIFSPYDLSCALENGASLECKGYVKEDAARLAVNVILFALQQ